ncbi:MAG: hypothetical protein KJN60_08035 [Boseongicola sp.]|nr:hypothetical protein [Boseongicola sp.]
MSERWGFDLSIEAVRLMRYRLGEWQEFAVQKLEDDDIEARLAELVAKVETPASVDIFLPRDQILFTDVKVGGDTPTAEEIFSAMDGRTPYDLADLEIDWEATGRGTARVAAIATQTLDEAEAFVTKGGLTVRAFSSLASPEDFPRIPIFVEREAAPLENPAPDINEDEPAEAPAFSSARKTPPPLVLEESAKAPSLKDDDSPVVKVDDPTPVLQLPETDLPPLNPGTPLPRPTSQPRVVTNVGASAAAARAASLTATPSVAIRHRDRAVPTPALLGVAAALSIGVAIIIWSIIPSTPESSLVTPATVGAAPETAPQVADVTPPPAAEEPPASPPLPFDITEVSVTPTAPAQAEAGVRIDWTSASVPNPVKLDAALISASNLTSDPYPTIGWLEPRPIELAAIEDYAPVAFASSVLTVPERPTFGIAASFEPISSAEIATLATPPTLEPLDLSTTLETDAPDAFIPPVVAETADSVEPAQAADETQSAALNPVVEDTLEAPALRPIAEAEELAPAPTAEADAIQPKAEKPEIATSFPDETVAPRLVQTALAAGLPDTAPRPRPGAFLLEIERQKFGGRSLDELAEIRPGTRPDSAQIEALVARAGNPPSDLAVTNSVAPQGKPRDFDAIVAAAVIQQRQEREARTLAALTPDTSGAIEAALAEEREAEQATRPQNSPRLAIPSNASVARQATIDDAMRLNRINLVGVFGRPTDRRALVRLPSGRYVKVKIGDSVDGGTVAGISDSALQYQKGGRTVSLTMPQG